MKSQRYKFRGKVIECDPNIIKQLNYALALNKSKDRYEEVKDKKNEQ